MKSIHESDPEGLFDRAFKIKLSSKKLKKSVYNCSLMYSIVEKEVFLCRLEKEFQLKKEKQATENSNLIVSQV